MKKQAIIVSFSSRAGGNCEKISTFIRSTLQLPVKTYRFADFSIHPCGACHYECFENNRSCPYIGDMEYTLLEEICASTFTYFVLPNYCNFPPAQFFAFNERSQCYFQNHNERLEAYLNVPKQFIVVSNTGKQNFIEALQQQTNAEPEILFLSAKQYGKISVAGDILESDAAKADIQSFIHR